MWNCQRMSMFMSRRMILGLGSQIFPDLLLAWLTVFGMLSTYDLLQKRCMNVFLSPNWCVMCRCSLDLNHLLVHCLFTRSVWNKVLDELGLQWVTPPSTSDLLMINLGGRINKNGGGLWGVIVPVVFWSIWLERNNRIFEQSTESLTEVWDRIKYRGVTGHKRFKNLSVIDQLDTGVIPCNLHVYFV